MTQAHRDRPGDAHRGARQDHHPPRRRRPGAPTPGSTSPSSAASRSSARAGRSGRWPGITARICGICPVSHLLASAKAGDQILAVTIPPAAEKLRRLMNLAQIVQSHALSFFHLSAPDLLLGLDSDPARRNVFGLVAAEPELARGGIRLRQFGQEIIELLGGKKIHPAWAVPGGVRGRPDRGGPRPHPRPRPRGAGDHPGRARPVQGAPRPLPGGGPRPSATSPRCSWAWSAADGDWEHYDGTLRFVDGEGKIVADGLDPSRYRRVHRRGGRAGLVPEVAVLPAAGLSRRHLPRRPAGAAQRLHAHGHAAGRPGAGGVPRPRPGARSPRRSSSTTPG